jgi:hypothetical protein
LQVEVPTHINITHFDLCTKFDEIYYVPVNPWLDKAKATKKDPDENKEDKKPSAI